jgi:hypothetical protein
MLAEDLVVLLVEDSSGRQPRHRGALAAVAGAVLAELALSGRLDVEIHDRRPRLFVVSDEPLGHPVLDDVLALAAEVDGSRIEQVLDLVAAGLWERMLNRLTEQGILARVSRKRFGLSVGHTWEVESPVRREELRARLGAVVADGVVPEGPCAVLLWLLHQLGVLDMLAVAAQADWVASLAGAQWADDVVEAVLDAVIRVRQANIVVG